MPVYSPPLTRQRARALFIAQQQQEQQQLAASDEQPRRQPGQTTRERRRPQQRGATGEESEKPEKAFLSRRAAGTVDSRPRGSRAPAETRPTGSGTLGNSGSRCRKGLFGRHARRGGRNSDPTTEGDRCNNNFAEEMGQQQQQQQQHQQMAVNDAETRPESVFISSSSSSSESVCSSSPPDDACEGDGAQGGSASRNESEVGVEVEVGVELSCLQQPLEEVNPSVLNAKANTGSGSSSSAVVGFGSGKEDGELGDGGGVTPPNGDEAIEKIGPEGIVDGAIDDSAKVNEERFSRAAAPAASDSSGTSDVQILPPTQGSGRGQHPQGPASGIGVSSPGGGVVFDRQFRGDDRSGSGNAASRAADAGVVRDEGVKETRLSGGGRGLTGLRLRGKAMGATEGDDEERVSSTGASPLQKRNRRELKLSEEEVAMAGAPQGPVYQVAVLETREFERSVNPEEEMQAVHAAAGGGGDWADLYSAVDSTRRLCIFHAGVIAREGNLEGAVGLLVSAVGNLRSSMVRNALLGVGDMFRFLGKDMGKVDVCAMVAGTLQRMAGEKRFICHTAVQAMEAAARNGPGIEVLHAILPSIDDRNPEVSSKAAHFAEQCLGALGVGSKAGAGMPESVEFQPLVAGLGRALGGKMAEGRSAARRGLLRSRKAMGSGPFEAVVTESLEKAEATSLLAALAAPNRDGARAGGNGKGGGGGRGFSTGINGARGGKGGRGNAGASAARPSIREQMMAAKRKKMEEERRAAAKEGNGSGRAGKASGSGFVIVT